MWDTLFPLLKKNINILCDKNPRKKDALPHWPVDPHSLRWPTRSGVSPSVVLHKRLIIQGVDLPKAVTIPLCHAESSWYHFILNGKCNAYTGATLKSWRTYCSPNFGQEMILQRPTPSRQCLGLRMPNLQLRNLWSWKKQPALRTVYMFHQIFRVWSIHKFHSLVLSSCKVAQIFFDLVKESKDKIYNIMLGHQSIFLMEQRSRIFVIPIMSHL